MLVSIIVPTFNSADTIQSNIESIKEQTYKNYEVIIIDNNSSDETIKILKNNNFSNIKMIVEKDRGIFDAINKGIKNSSGDLISVLHSDDFYDNKFVLDKIVKTFNSKNVDIVYGDLVYVKKNNINSVIRYWQPGIFKDKIFLRGWSPPHPSFIVKKKYLELWVFINQKLEIQQILS